MRTWWNSRHVGPRSRWAKAHEGAIPSVRTSLSRRGWNVDTTASKPVGRDCPCRCDSGRRDQLCGRAWNRRPGGLKNRRAARRVSVQVAPAASDFFGEWRNSRRPSLRNSWAKARAGANPVSPTNFSASSSNESRRPVSQAGNAGASPVEAATFRRVVRSQPCVL